MTVLKPWLLLALLNVWTIIQPIRPTNSECNKGIAYMFSSISESGGTYTITCKQPNATLCDRAPCVQKERKYFNLDIYVCSPSYVINFLHKCYENIIVPEATISVTNSFLTTADMDSLKIMKQILNIKLDADSTIPINATYSWSYLTILTIQGGKLNSQQLTEVNMTRLPANSFYGLKSLMYLQIQDNKNIEIIEADAFRGLDELQKLHLIHGNLKCIEVGAFSGLPMLRSLDLSYNVIEQLPDGLLQSLENIVEVLLQGNPLKVIDTHAFARIPSLNLIDISNCTITRLSGNVFSGSNNIKTLYIDKNNLESLPPNIFRDLRHLERLYLGYNRLQDPRKVNIFDNLMTLKDLDLSNNQIRILPKSLFLELSNLEILNLSNNNISYIDDSLVRDGQYLLEIQNDKIEQPFEYYPFNYFAKLKRLSLAENQIRWLGVWEPPLHLENLNLSRNKIDSYDIARVNITVDLSYNQIIYIKPKAAGILHNIKSNNFLYLTGNPIQCDCTSYELYLRLNEVKRPGKLNYVLDSYCIEPHFNGQHLKDISPELLTCDHTNCPKSCSSCTVIKNGIHLNCQKLPSKDFFEGWNKFILTFYQVLSVSIIVIDIESISLKVDNQPISLESRNINSLNLSNAGIHNLTLIPNNYLNTLDVSHNDISKIPDVFLKGNYRLYLSNNPFECECEFLKGTSVLHNRSLVPDYNEITCTDGENVVQVNQIDIDEFCHRSIRLISVIGYSTIGSFVALVAVIKLYLNAHNIWMSLLRIFCKRKYERTRIGMRELGIEEAKIYDLFISFAHQDESFVAKTLLPKLEKEFNQKVCVHTRDWIVGNVIATQIIESVEKSRRTVIILSEHFLMSEWSEVEFHTAHSWSIQEGKPRIIIILLKEEVARDERMGVELKSYIASNTYLLWGDPLFWEKLQKVLPGKIPKCIW